MKDDPMTGAWIVEVAIAALAFLLIARVLGVPVTGYSAAISLAISGVVVIVIHVHWK
jgi:hypothetical protein